MLLCMSVTAQKASLKGLISDTSSKQNLQNATISLLRNKDTVLYKYTRSNEAGGFELKNLNAGKYIVMVSSPTYADYRDDITLEDASSIDLGKIILTTKAHLLEDVVVRQRIAAIRMKGDTLEYKADSFKVREGANVEDMLRKLPGITVDKNGKITAQGEKVEKVLVDGEEFFGNDPTIATRNLDAAAIDKVQVFDKKSDQAAFTGIDDGTKTKTINLTLKDDKKKGIFGKMELGAGPDDKWNNSIMANAFKGKRKLSFYGIMSSTGTTGLDWDDINKYGDNSSITSGTTDDGGMYINMSGDEFSGSSYYGEGIPKVWTGAVNYGNKFNNDKQNLNGSYRYNKLATEGNSSTTTQSILPDTLFFNNKIASGSNIKERNTISGSFDWMIDSSFSVKITANGYKGNTTSINSVQSLALNQNKDTVNTSAQNTSSYGTNQSFNSTALIRKKFKKIGRTISLSIDQKYVENNSDGYLYSLNQFYEKTGLISQSDTTDQKKTNGGISNSLTGKIAYTEPIIKNLTAEINYGLSNTKSESKLLSYDKDGSGKYNTLNNLYSNDYSYNILTNSGGMMLRYNTKKYNFSAGGDVSNAHYDQKDLIKDSSFAYNYVNFFPRANATYKFNQNSRINFNYNGNTKQPTIQQVQPVANNNNPLNIAVGNPDLKQEFTHTFRMSYNSYQVLKQKGFYISGNFRITPDAIRTNTYTDSLGRSIYKYVNTDGNYNFGGWAGYNQKITKLDLNFGVNYSYNYANSVTYVNFLKNVNTNTNQRFEFDFYKNKEKKFDIYLQFAFMYNTSVSSIRPDIKNNYWSMEHSLDGTVQLPGKFELHSSTTFNLRERTAVFTTNNNVILWDAYLAKKIFKGDKSQIRFTAHDILNQNKGFSRDIGSASITETTYQNISRYFLLSFIWNFNKNAASAKN